MGKDDSGVLALRPVEVLHNQEPRIGHTGLEGLGSVTPQFGRRTDLSFKRREIPDGCSSESSPRRTPRRPRRHVLDTHVTSKGEATEGGRETQGEGEGKRKGKNIKLKAKE